MRGVVLFLLALAASLALLLAATQNPFADSRFEFQQYRRYEGDLRARPYPVLQTPERRYLLVAPGKFGADGMTAGLDGKRVSLEGALIARGPEAMLELLPGSLAARGNAGEARVPPAERAVELTGEIVDSKCYLGVMNPGQGKTHRDCAVRCISGGIPPALAVRDASGTERVVVLVGRQGEPMNKSLLPYVGEPVTVRGLLGEYLKVESLRRVE